MMFTEYIRALFFIFIAEMGDKTQILAMMFATKFPMRKVFLGIFIGSFLNHGLAVAFGSLLGSLIEPYVLQVVAGAAFLGFAIWTLAAGGDEEEVEESDRGHGAVAAVAAAFFIGELGDKTQLTAITLSIDAAFPLLILAGTVSGMVLTSGIGILAGSKLGSKMPEYLIKLFSGLLFFIFGSMKLASSAPEAWKNGWTYGAYALLASLVLLLAGRTAYRQRHRVAPTAYARAAEALYQFTHEMEIRAEDICRGAAHCGHCQGEACAVGFIKHLLKEMESGADPHSHEEVMEQIVYQYDKFSAPKLQHALEMTRRYLAELEPESPAFDRVDTIRTVLERMLAKKEDA